MSTTTESAQYHILTALQQAADDGRDGDSLGYLAGVLHRAGIPSTPASVREELATLRCAGMVRSHIKILWYNGREVETWSLGASPVALRGRCS